jgi:hypothetical protein
LLVRRIIRSQGWIKIDHWLGEGRNVAKPRREPKPKLILDKTCAVLEPSGVRLHHVWTKIEGRKAGKFEDDIVAAGGNTSRHFYLRERGAWPIA